MAYTPQVPTRSDWRTQRNAAKVPQGAAKVSIGEWLDRFRKSWDAQDLEKNLVDTRQLLANLITYADTVKQKYPKIIPTVHKIKGKVDDHREFLEGVAKAKIQYYPIYSEITKAFLKVKLKADDAPQPKDLRPAITTMKGIIDTMALVDPKWEPKRKIISGLFLNFDGGHFKQWRKSDDDSSIVDDVEKKLQALRP